MRMKRENAPLMITLVAIFGILVVVLSFVAYANRIKVEDVSISSDGSCMYPRSISRRSFGFGIIAAICLLNVQLIVSVETGCYCCGGNSCPKNFGGITSLILFILSWMTFILGFTGLIGSAILNNISYLTKFHPRIISSVNNVEFCYLGNQNVFIWAAIWSIICIFLGLASYIIALKTSANANGNRDSESH